MDLRFRRALSFFLAMALCISMVPTAAFADEGEAAEIVEEMTEAPEETLAPGEEPSAPTQEETAAPSQEPEEPAAPSEEVTGPSAPLCAHDHPEAACPVCHLEQLILALPTVEEAQNLEGEDLRSAREACQAATEAYLALSDEEQAQVSGLEKLIALYGYFAEPITLSAVPGAKALPELTGNQAKDVAAIAKSQLGYKENSQGTIYGQWWSGVAGGDYTAQPWCAMFAAWCANKAGIGLNKAYDTTSAKVSNLWKWYKNNAAYDSSFKTEPRVGDFIFFKNSDGTAGHVAIVTGYSGGKVTFVGGNQSNKVTESTVSWKKGAAWGSQTVLGYGRPAYKDTSVHWVSDTVSWTVKNGTLTFSGTGPIPDNIKWPKTMPSFTALSIGSGITGIGANAFKGFDTIAKVTLPSSLEYIGANAFSGCSGITALSIPDAVSVIGDGAFVGTAITKITLPEALTALGANVFQGCALTEIAIPEAVTSLGAECFLDCTGLKNLSLPQGLMEIGAGCFENTGLTALTIPETVTSLGEGAFRNCFWLEDISLPSGLTAIADETFLGCGALTEIDLPAALETIGSGAFRGCTGLGGIDLPGSLSRVGSFAFDGCSGFTTLSVPAGCAVEERGFGYCVFLRSVTVGDYAVLHSNAFLGCVLLTDITLGDHVQAAEDAFSEPVLSGALKDLRWEMDMDSGVMTFSGSGRIPDYDPAAPAPWVHLSRFATTLNLGSGVTAVGDYAFADFTALKYLNLSEGLKEIGAGSFVSCHGLEYLEIPDKLETIHPSAFAACAGLETVVFLGDAPEMELWQFGVNGAEIWCGEAAVGFGSLNLAPGNTLCRFDDSRPVRSIALVMDLTAAMDTDTLRADVLDLIGALAGAQNRNRITLIPFTGTAWTLCADTAHPGLLREKAGAIGPTGAEEAHYDAALALAAGADVVLFFAAGENAGAELAPTGQTIYGICDGGQLDGLTDRVYEPGDMSQLITILTAQRPQQTPAQPEGEETSARLTFRGDTWSLLTGEAPALCACAQEPVTIQIVPGRLYDTVHTIALCQGDTTVAASQTGLFENLILSDHFAPGGLSFRLLDQNGLVLQELELRLELVESFSVTYMDGDQVLHQGSYIPGHEIPAPTEPSRAGCLFAGWFSSPEAGGLPFFHDQNLSRRLDAWGELILYAGWAADADALPPDSSDGPLYLESVTFHHPGRENATIYVAAGSLIPEEAVPLSDAGESLDWYRNDQFTGDPWDFEWDTVEEELHLYAKTDLFTVRYETNTGDLQPMAFVRRGGLAPQPQGLYQMGRTLCGWCTDQALTQDWDFSTPVTANLTLYARWEDNIFDAAGNDTGICVEILDADAITYTGKAVKPQVIVRDSGKILKAGTDYTISYKNNVSAADCLDPELKESKRPRITIQGKGNYKSQDKIILHFTIRPAPMADLSITVPTLVSASAGNKLRTLKVTAKTSRITVNAKHYTIRYYNDEAVPQLVKGITEPGIYYVQLVAKNANYQGESDLFPVEVIPARLDVSNASLTLGKNLRALDAPCTEDEALALLISKLTLGGETYTTKADSLEQFKSHFTVTASDAYGRSYAQAELGRLLTVAGKSAITVTARPGNPGDLQGSEKGSLTIKGGKLTKDQFAVTFGDAMAADYCGTSQVPRIVSELLPGQDYTVSYKRGSAAVSSWQVRDAGSYTLVITGLGGYTGSVSYKFTIRKVSLAKAFEAGLLTVQTSGTAEYAPTGARPLFTLGLTSGSSRVPLLEGRDYTLTLSGNKAITEKAAAKLTGKGNFTGSLTTKQCEALRFRVTPKPLGGSDISITVTSVTRKAGAISSAKVTLRHGAKTISTGEYRAVLEDMGDDYRVTVIGRDKLYTGRRSIRLSKDAVATGDSSQVSISLSDGSLYLYTGSSIRPRVTILDEKGRDISQHFTVTYGTNTKVGSGSVTITGDPSQGYYGSKTLKFTILPRWAAWLLG